MAARQRLWSVAASSSTHAAWH